MNKALKIISDAINFTRDVYLQDLLLVLNP